MLNFLRKKQPKETNDEIEFTWQPRPINNKGKETIDDMSLIYAPYLDFILTKTGHLVSMIEVSGINLELLNNEEQAYVFDVFNSFLMNTLGDNSNETQQYLDVTMPVDFENYLLSYKKRYLQEENPAKRRLIASYIYDMQEKSNRNEMSTKRHILVLKVKIKDKSLTSLENKAKELDEKVRNYINRLEDDFEQYDLQAKKLYADEVKRILKNQMNFNGK